MSRKSKRTSYRVSSSAIEDKNYSADRESRPIDYDAAKAIGRAVTNNDPRYHEGNLLQRIGANRSFSPALNELAEALKRSKSMGCATDNEGKAYRRFDRAFAAEQLQLEKKIKADLKCEHRRRSVLAKNRCDKSKRKGRRDAQIRNRFEEMIHSPEYLNGFRSLTTKGATKGVYATLAEEFSSEEEPISARQIRRIVKTTA